MEKKPEKALFIYERDPNYQNVLVTDARGGQVNEDMYRITFYEEFPDLPILEIVDIDNTGRIDPDTIKAIGNTSQITDPSILQELKDSKVALIRRVEKTTISLNKATLKRLRDWLNTFDL